jgi:uncharacterized protein (TIGR02597 family)
MTTTPKSDSQNIHATSAKNPPAAPTHFHNPTKKPSNSMRMKSTSLTLAASAVLAALPLANAQNVTATTDPVGFVTVTVNANSDQNIGVPMVCSAVYKGTASVVSGTSVSASNLPTLTSSGSNLLLVTSGSASGSWEIVSSSTNSTVVLAAAIPGFSTNATFLIRPFWTLNTLFPGGGAIPKSSDPFNPVGLVYVNDPAAVGVNLSPSAGYFYHDGSLGPAGWYQNGDLGAGLQGDVALTPEAPIIIRNITNSQISVPFVGVVPVNKFALDVVKMQSAYQDNRIMNQFPASVTLEDSNLVSSGALSPSPDPFNPTDTLIVNNLSQSGFNPSPNAVYFYHDGSLGPVGWYQNGDLGAGLQNDVQLPAGCSIIIRKASGASSTIAYTPDIPYSL